jgi:hypothetical protein
MLFANARG